MAEVMKGFGHQRGAQAVTQADPVSVSEADLICIGTLVKGLFIILRHPTEGSMQFVERLGNRAGKKAMVFCPYKLAAESTLPQMAKALKGKGVEVIGKFGYRGPELNSEFTSFALF